NMIIELKKFGTTLISRQAGREAYSALQPLLRNLTSEEDIEVDFEGVLTFSPSWGDEVLSPLLNIYGGKLVLKNTNNPSVQATMEILEKTTGKKFNVI
ncbi:STAS-like domain-containing protein, partial [Patescibacteria group bacterium]|nr:STAS-like domain-containing protein [Patescibacteria group bacterium]